MRDSRDFAAFTLEDLITTLEQARDAAEAEQAEIKASQLTPETNPGWPQYVCDRDPRWQYLDGLRVAFNTARELAIGMELEQTIDGLIGRA